jgi:hypothetical protein
MTEFAKMSDQQLKEHFLKTRNIEALSAYLERPNPQRLTIKADETDLENKLSDWVEKKNK